MDRQAEVEGDARTVDVAPSSSRVPDDGNLSTEAREGNIARENSTASRAQNFDRTKPETISFVDHSHNVYVWPYKLCRTYETTKTLIENVYRFNATKLQLVKNDAFDILDERDAIILPVVWADIVLPSTTITIRFSREPYERSRSASREPRIRRTVRLDTGSVVDEPPPPPPVPARSSTSSDDREEDESTSEGEVLEVIPARSESESGQEDEDVDSTSIASEEHVQDPELDNLDWIERPPFDNDGNPLSFKVNTFKAHRLPLSQPQKLEAERNNPDVSSDSASPSRSLDALRITKALTIESEGRSKIQVHILPGPENTRNRKSVGITWYHLPARGLDFPRFRDACLSIPQLPERLKRLTKEMLLKLEKHKVKTYLNGLFIEPGTVVRVDETCQQDPQSIIFSCVPYYSLEQMEKRIPAGSGDRLFNLRTLMQTFYPYEPVRDRDAEQAYRMFSNDHSKNMIYVPNMWIMNIGPDIVLTSSRSSLTQEMVNSLEIVRDDTNRLTTSLDLAKNPVTAVRITDGTGRVSIFGLPECRTYFELEQKFRTLKVASRHSTEAKTLRLIWKTEDHEQAVTPMSWPSTLKRTDLVFIDLFTVNTSVERKYWDQMQDKLPATVTVLPFFSWPLGANSMPSQSPSNSLGNDSINRPTRCLDHVEKSILEETLEPYETINAVDKSFATTEFYQGLPEDTRSHIIDQFNAIQPIADPGTLSTYHEKIVQDQKIKMAELSIRFCDTVGSTLSLFAQDIDKTVMLRKVWGAMGNILRVVGVLQSLDRTSTMPVTDWTTWWVRNSGENKSMPLPYGSQHFQRFVRKCRRCKRPFETEEAALNHLQRHVKPATKRSATQDLQKEVRSISGTTTAEPNLKDWTIDGADLRQEETCAGALAILTLACKVSRDLFVQAQEVSTGVLNEKGKMSGLYTLPKSLLDAFRSVIIFYLAIERAIHFTEEFCLRRNYQDPTDGPLPFSEQGLERLTWFGNTAGRFFSYARADLCYMTAATPPPSAISSLSLGPEYLCSWLVRRLLVRPLEGQLTIGDMYREYLSTIQFQVNHRPGKRLLRSINLLQEELQVLISINDSQVKLIENYVKVLDNESYEKDTPSRRTMFTYERLLLNSITDNLALAREDYEELSKRCRPLSDKTKQSLEINEEDHGKAIMVFTIVTIVFLPLSFVTSYLGMNTSDIRDMDNRQSLFWLIAIPLTAFTIATMMFIGFNGDELRDFFSATYRRVTGKQDTSSSARGLSAAQRKRSRPLNIGVSDASDTTSLAYEAEFANPEADWYSSGWTRRMLQAPMRTNTAIIYNTTRDDNDTVPVGAPPLPGERSFIRRMPTEWAPDDPTYEMKYSSIATRRPSAYLAAEDRWPAEDERYSARPRRGRSDREERLRPSVGPPTRSPYDDDEWYTSRLAGRDNYTSGARHVVPPVQRYSHTNRARRGSPSPEYRPEYTWHKEQKRFHSRRTPHATSGFGYRTMGNMDGAGDDNYTRQGRRMPTRR